MRLANTTFVNLRSALERPHSRWSTPPSRWRPSFRSCSSSCGRWPRTRSPRSRTCRASSAGPGPNNDLIDLTKLGVPLAAATVDNINVDGENRPGAFPQSTTALNDSTPELATARPYAVDLTGWFEGYTPPGHRGRQRRRQPDRAGHRRRLAAERDAQPAAVVRRPDAAQRPGLRRPRRRARLKPGGRRPGRTGLPVGSGGTSSSGNSGLIVTGQGSRCPGSMERGAVYYPESGFPCNPKQVPTGS